MTSEYKALHAVGMAKTRVLSGSTTISIDSHPLKEQAMCEGDISGKVRDE